MGTVVKFFMRIFFVTIILIFSIQSLIVAEDIRDFDIEGLSVGKSLLDHMTKQEIKEASFKESGYRDETYTVVDYKNYKNNSFDKILIAYKTGDIHFIINEVKAVLNLDNPTDCLIQKNDHYKTVKEFFPKETKIERYEIKELRDPSGKSFTNKVDFILEDGEITIFCDYYSEEYYKNTNSSLKSHLAVAAYDNEFAKYLLNK